MAGTTKEALKVELAAMTALRNGGQAVRLGRQMPGARLLGLAHGSPVTLQSGGERQLVSLAPARFTAGEWRMPVFVHPVEPGATRELLLRQARRLRRDMLLEPMVAG